MSIAFHCPYCSASISAPDDTGGKKGRCPKCQQMVYIPLPDSAGESFDLIPLDHDDERHRDAMMDESFATRLDLLAADEWEENPDDTQAYRMIKTRDVPRLVFRYLLAMANANLPRAERIATALRGHKRATVNHIEKLIDEKSFPPELAPFPEPLLLGFLQKLRDEF